MQRLAIAVLALFLLLFPKGGIKLGGIPLTFGYAFTGVVALFRFPQFIQELRSGYFSGTRLLTGLAALAFGGYGIVAFVFDGIESREYAAAFVASFVVLPLIFIIVLRFDFDALDEGYVLQWIKGGVLFVAVYGLFLFAYKQVTGAFIEVPYLTMNADDVGMLETKHIDRAGVFKLISTYNNGNIYGVCVVMLLPIYRYIERREICRLIVLASLILTLSRTVWIGVILSEVAEVVMGYGSSKSRIARFLAIMGLACGAILFCIGLMGFGNEFLADKTLGGRDETLSGMAHMTFLSQNPFGGIGEMVLVSVASEMGVCGAFFFIVAMLTPVLLYAVGAVRWKPEWKRAVFTGMILYLVVAQADGAILLIPVMAFYWIMAALLLSERHRVACLPVNSAGDSELIKGQTILDRL